MLFHFVSLSDNQLLRLLSVMCSLSLLSSRGALLSAQYHTLSETTEKVTPLPVTSADGPPAANECYIAVAMPASPMELAKDGDVRALLSLLQEAPLSFP